MSPVNVQVGCVPPVTHFRLCGMQTSFGAEHCECLGESWAMMAAKPISGVATPLDVEAVGVDPVQTGEGRVKLLAGIFREAGAVTPPCARESSPPFGQIFHVIPSDTRSPSMGAAPQPVCVRAPPASVRPAQTRVQPRTAAWPPDNRKRRSCRSALGSLRRSRSRSRSSPAQGGHLPNDGRDERDRCVALRSLAERDGSAKCGC